MISSGVCQLPGFRVVALSLALLAGHGSALSQVTNGTLLKTFNNPTPAVFDTFGYSTAAFGSDRVLIGAYGAGEAYLFNFSGTLLTTISNPSPGAGFGSAVAAVGDDSVLIANENFFDMYEGQLHQLGRAYLYTADGTLLNTFTNPSPASVRAFGAGGVAALGSDRVIIAYPGGVFLFRTNGELVTTITNPAPAVAKEFGIGMSALGSDRVIIGAPLSNTGANWAGIAYLFSVDGTLLATFSNPDPVEDDNFGRASAAVGNDHVVIGAIDYGGVRGGGAAYLFNTNGALITTFINPDSQTNDYFGSSIAAVGSDRVLIGAYQTSAGAFQCGTAYLFSTNGAILHTFTSPNPASQDFFGASVAAVGSDRVLIGSVWKDTGATEAGAAYLFALSNPSLSMVRSNGLITISWPGFPGFELQQNTDLNLVNWTTPQETITDNGTTKSISVSPAPSNRFFRLLAP